MSIDAALHDGGCDLDVPPLDVPPLDVPPWPADGVVDA